MKITTEEFISSFHSLTGTTIGERQKNLYLLLNKIEKCERSELDLDLLDPKTPLEEKFKVDTLIYFKRVPELLAILKSENPILIKRILKFNSWLIEAFQNISGEELVNSIFPHISFNAKVKLLNKLALNVKNSERGDEYFKCVEEKYGFYLASKLIPCCSLDLIMKCIKVNRLKMMSKHLLLIIKKQPAITELILKELNATGKVRLAKDYKNVFRYLAENDITLFLKLQKEYNVSIELGWRITSKYVKRNQKAIIRNPKDYYETFHKKQIAKSLNRNFPDMFLNMFLTTIDGLRDQHHYYNLIRMCENLPNRICDVVLLLKTFERVYGSNLWEHSDFINLRLLDMLPMEYREIIVKIETRPDYIPEEKWYSYMKTEISIPYLKKSISLSSTIKTRAKLISLLVKTCKINSDKEALANLCNYMVTKHRNDDISVRSAFLETLETDFELEDLEEKHWTPINKLIEIFTLNGEQFYKACSFNLGYLHYCLKNGMDIKNELIKYIKESQWVISFNIIIERPEYEKKCLLMFGELLSVACEGEKLEKCIFAFLRSIIHWNERHPDDQISLFDYVEFMNKVKQTLKVNGCDYEIAPIVDFCIYKLKADSKDRQEILKCSLPNVVDIKLVIFLLKTEPLTIKDNVNVVTKPVLDIPGPHYLFWIACTYYTHLEIPQEIIKICEDSPDKGVMEYERDDVISNSILALSYLMPNDRFIDFIKPYYPTELTANSKSAEEYRTYTYQQNIGKCLKNLKPTSSALKSVSMFCKGDYLKLVWRSLYSLCGNINEDKLSLFLNELSDRAVSVRKHALHLTLRVLDKEHIYDTLTKFMNTERNTSMCKFIFKSTFNVFVHNPSDQTWEIFKSSITAVDVNDKEALAILLQTNKIPLQYFVDYVVFAWSIVHTLPAPKDVKDERIFTLIRFINSQDINLLPQEFCQQIIDTYFFKDITRDPSEFQCEIQTFVCKFIIYYYCNSEEEQDTRLHTIFETIKNCAYHDLNKQAELWNYISDVLQRFCRLYLDDDCNNIRILKTFVELWKNTFPPHTAFNEFLHLEFTLIYIKKMTLPEIGKKLAELCDELVNKFGNMIVPLFSSKIIHFHGYFLSFEYRHSEKMTLIESLLQPKPSSACLFLTIMLLDHIHQLYDDESKAQYKKVIEILKTQTDPGLQIYYFNHIKHRSFSETSSDDPELITFDRREQSDDEWQYNVKGADFS